MAFHTPHRHLSSLLILLVLVPSLVLLAPRQANAQVGSIAACLSQMAGSIASGGGAAIVNKITSVPTGDLLTQGATIWQSISKNCLDSFVWEIAKMAINRMKDSTISWINGGFNGNPLFIENPERFFGDIANQQLNYELYNLKNARDIYSRKAGAAVVSSEPTRSTIGDAITRNCLLSAERNGKLDTFASSYEAGDYTTRLARAEQKKEPQESGILASAIAPVRRALASVGLLAQALPPCPRGQTYNLETSPPVCYTPVPGGATTGGAGAGTFDNEGMSGICPTTPAEKTAELGRVVDRGEFSRCGWSCFGELVSNPQNTYIGATVQAKRKIAERQEEAAAAAQQESQNGVLPDKRCVQEVSYANEIGGTESFCVQYETVTPSPQVAAAAKEITASTFRQAEMTRTVNQALDQIAEALLGRLVQDGLSQIGNHTVRSAVSSAVSGARDKLQTQQSLKQNALGQFDSLIETVQRFILARQDTVAAITDILANIGRVQTEIASFSSPSYCPRTSARFGTLGSTDWATAQGRYVNQLDQARDRLTAVEGIRAQVDGASDPESISAAWNAYSQIVTSVPGPTDVQSAERDRSAAEAQRSVSQSLIGACQREYGGQAPPGS